MEHKIIDGRDTKMNIFQVREIFNGNQVLRFPDSTLVSVVFFLVNGGGFPFFIFIMAFQTFLLQMKITKI